MLFLVISEPRPEPPTDVAARRQRYWPWVQNLIDTGLVKSVHARVGRGAVAMFGAGGAGDAFVHQRPAQIVGAGLQACRHPIRPHLHPGDLDIGDQRMQHQARDRVHQHRLAEGRPLAGEAAQIHRRFHMHEGQGDELGEAARFRLQIAQHK